MVGPSDWNTRTELIIIKNHKHKKVPHHNLWSTNLPCSLSMSLTMAKEKRGYLLLLLLLSLLSLPPRCRPFLLLQPRCNDCHCHGCYLHRYHCRLPHCADCCLPPQFRLLSATAIATVATAATTDPVLATVAVTVRPYCHHHYPCSPCTCPLCHLPALLLLPMLLPLPLLTCHPHCHHSCHSHHRPLCCMTPLSPSLLPLSPSPSLSYTTLIVVIITLTTLPSSLLPSSSAACSHCSLSPIAMLCGCQCSLTSRHPPLMLPLLFDCCFLS
jgi:hypothetical protein